VGLPVEKNFNERQSSNYSNGRITKGGPAFYRRTRIAEALEERNTILESITDAFFAVDHNWIVPLEQYGRKDMGKSRNEVINKGISEKYINMPLISTAKKIQ